MNFLSELTDNQLTLPTSLANNKHEHLPTKPVPEPRFHFWSPVQLRPVLQLRQRQILLSLPFYQHESVLHVFSWTPTCLPNIPLTQISRNHWSNSNNTCGRGRGGDPQWRGGSTANTTVSLFTLRFRTLLHFQFHVNALLFCHIFEEQFLMTTGWLCHRTVQSRDWIIIDKNFW